MKKQTTMALAAAVVLLSGVSIASAATVSNAKPSDTLYLSTTQQRTAWRDIYMPSLNQATPKAFEAKVGAAVPSGVTTAPVPDKAASAVPALRPYHFAMLQKKLVIVNPSDQKIVEVISE
jgi:hypothetical protein